MDAKKELKLIEEILEKINSKMTSEELLSYALTRITKHYDYTSCGIIVYDKVKGDLKIQISKGLSQQFIKDFHTKRNLPLIEEVFQKEDAILVTEDHLHHKKEGYRFEHDYEILYITPLRIGGEIIGAIYFDSEQKEGFSQEDLGFFRDFANICALIIDHSNLVDYINKTADHDTLTGLYSYKYFHEELDREMKRAERAHYPVTLFLGSIGHLGEYNSVFGHIAGDQAIITISQIIMETIRRNDIAARYGNKFVIIFPDAEVESVSHVAERICHKIDKEAFKGSDPRPVLRIGLASFPKDGGEEKKLITHAERNLYESKRKGGNVFTY